MKSSPVISVIICTYNREKFLPNALDSLKNQTADKSIFEIVIVNNNSTDSTEEISLTFQKNNPQLQVVYVVEKNPGLSFARNKGIVTAKSELISFIDDDAIARTDFVDNLLSAFKNYPDFGAIGGKVIPIYESGKEPIWMNPYIQGVVSKVDYGNNTIEFKKKYPAGCNMSFKKGLFDQHGFFNTDLVYRGDDKFVFTNFRKKGVKILYDPNVFVNHYIDGYRTEPKFIDKISKSIGASERLRLQNSGILPNMSKILEYLFKLGVSFGLFISYTFKGQFAKGLYSVRVMWHTILGFLSANKSASL